MKNIDKLAQQSQAMHRRIDHLYQNAGTVVLPVVPNVLPQALKELGHASEMVQLVLNELQQQHEQLAEVQDLVAKERQRYQELFQSAPEPYFVTDAKGLVEEVNAAAARLFNYPVDWLVGKPLTNLIVLEHRQQARAELLRGAEGDRIRDLEVRMQPRHGQPFDAVVTLTVVRDTSQAPIRFRWLVRDLSDREALLPAAVRKRAQLALSNNHGDLSQQRPVHTYSKGEIIPLNPQELWYVAQGWVKLSTVGETGEEVMVGLTGTGMVFGSSLTSLPTYQATALADVQLVSVHLSEIPACPTLSQTLLPKINQRLQQTELFLAVSGRRRVEDRLYSMLQVLKQVIGQPMLGGTRLGLRLTHEDLASACCTTRVTITRLMGKLQQEGKISFDAKNHIIIADDK